MIDERTERLINRRLDGELTDEEALELNKRLIRTPEARQLLEEFERNDRLACEALGAWAESANTASSRSKETAVSVPDQRRRYVGAGLWAAAAALLLISMVGAPARWNATPEEPLDAFAPPVATFASSTPTPLTTPPLIEGPREETHQLHRDVVGVWDEETESVYVLELDQHAEKIIPVAMNF